MWGGAAHNEHLLSSFATLWGEFPNIMYTYIGNTCICESVIIVGYPWLIINLWVILTSIIHKEKKCGCLFDGPKLYYLGPSLISTRIDRKLKAPSTKKDQESVPSLTSHYLSFFVSDMSLLTFTNWLVKKPLTSIYTSNVWTIAHHKPRHKYYGKLYIQPGKNTYSTAGSVGHSNMEQIKLWMYTGGT
jgi:hypothetical protein